MYRYVCARYLEEQVAKMREMHVLQMTSETFAKRMPMVFEWNSKSNTVSFSKCSVCFNMSPGQSFVVTWQGRVIDGPIPEDMTPTLCKWINDFVATCPIDLHESLRGSAQSLACGLNTLSANTPLDILFMRLVICVLSSLIAIRSPVRS